MEYFLVRYDSRVVIYDRRGFIRLATGVKGSSPEYYSIYSQILYDICHWNEKKTKIDKKKPGLDHI